jgi:hypothetical protein
MLHRLIIEADLRPRDAAMPTPHGRRTARCAANGAFRLVADPSAKRDIPLASTYRYKVLDDSAVLLCDIDRSWRKTSRSGCTSG